MWWSGRQVGGGKGGGVGGVSEGFIDQRQDKSWWSCLVSDRSRRQKSHRVGGVGGGEIRGVTTSDLAENLSYKMDFLSLIDVLSIDYRSINDLENVSFFLNF